jgi:hypothetical protein
LPAIGQRGLKYPENLIPKLGRAVLDDAGDPLVLQVRKLLADAAKTKRYDAIFVDVRAGLSESSAAALLSLGGDMLLFGVDAPQTFEDYRYLFAHLNRYAGFDDWRSRLQMVQAKSPGRADDLRGFRERASDLFAEYIYDEIPAGTAPNDLFNFDIDDDTAPHYPWVVEFDQTYLQFDPTTRPEQLEAERFQRAFGGFLERIRDLIFSDSEE